MIKRTMKKVLGDIIMYRSRKTSSFSLHLLTLAAGAVLLFAGAVQFSPMAQAQDPLELDLNPGLADLASELANPNTSLGFLAAPIDFVTYDGDAPGADEQTATRISFQPSLPYSLGDGKNLYVRPLIPVYIDQPVPLVGGEVALPGGDAGIQSSFESTGVELGDISFDVAVGNSFDNGMIVVAGVVGTLPTATDDRLGLDQYLLGPELLVGKKTSWGFVGGLLTHQWDVAGEDGFDTSITGGQYFYTVDLNDGWQIQATPTFSYNHEASSGNRLSFPLAIGVSKLAILGGTPWKFSLQYWEYVESPDEFGPERQIRFQVGPVVPLPW